ncbi:MAG TPA: hypothetical protein VFB34_04685 [Chloroflexota bacterium]|nr:hypothetical protein [Chloroflexota bacterium]
MSSIFFRPSSTLLETHGWDGTSVFALLSPGRLARLTQTTPDALPSECGPGEWLPSTEWRREDADFAAVSTDELFDCLPRWEAAVHRCAFEGQRGKYGRPAAGRLRLLSRVERWSRRDLWLWCWQQVQACLDHLNPQPSDDGRLIAAVEAARDHHEGRTSLDALAEARRRAKEFYAEIPPEDYSERRSWIPMRRAAYAARASILIATPNPGHYPSGYTAMAAAQIAHDMHNQHPEGYISTKWLGVSRIASFLDWLDAGELWERDLIRHDLWPDGQGRRAPIDLPILPGDPAIRSFDWEAGHSAVQPIRTDQYEGVLQPRSCIAPEGNSYLEQDGVPATRRYRPGLLALDLQR